MTISESDFLLAELGYSVDQVRAQIAHLSQEVRPRAEHILEDMAAAETRFQRRLAQRRIEDESPGENGLDFASRRAHTLALLGRIAQPWPEALLEVVRQQVADDRGRATALATLRDAKA